MSVIGSDKKKRLFIESYDPENPIISLRLAGYTGTDSYLKKKLEKFLEDPTIQKAIEKRNRYLESTQSVIANRTERQAFWSALMRNDTAALNIQPEYDSSNMPKKTENIPLAQRIKASELLGKSETDFVDRIDINHNITITDIIQQSYLDTEDLDVIEAQYTKLQQQEKEEAPQVTNETADKPNTPDLGDFL